MIQTHKHKRHGVLRGLTAGNQGRRKGKWRKHTHPPRARTPPCLFSFPPSPTWPMWAGSHTSSHEVISPLVLPSQHGLWKSSCRLYISYIISKANHPEIWTCFCYLAPLDSDLWTRKQDSFIFQEPTEPSGPGGAGKLVLTGKPKQTWHKSQYDCTAGLSFYKITFPPHTLQQDDCWDVAFSGSSFSFANYPPSPTMKDPGKWE